LVSASQYAITANTRGAKAPHLKEIAMTAVRGVRRVIDALTWFIIGMVFMSRMYCINLGITSGNNYIGWDTVVFVVGGLLMVQILLWIDPAFKDDNGST